MLRALPLFALLSLMGCVIEPVAEGGGAAGCAVGERRLADDGCNTCTCQADGSWACTQLACAAPCTLGEVRTPAACTECVCEADGWRCDTDCPDAGLACEPGSQWREGECRLCRCGDDGEPQCEDTCEPPTGGVCPPDCEGVDPEGDCVRERPWLADDGCNACACTEDGETLCTDVPSCAEGREDLDAGPADYSCTVDADCQPTGCGLDVCAAQPVAPCDDAVADTCFGPEITSCGCVEGRCAWAATPALVRCLAGPP